MNDIEPRLDLALLDPGERDPDYWDRFQRAVMQKAMPVLARRGKRVRLTVGGVLTSWSRLIVPGAAVAAAVAGIFFLPQPADEDAVPAPVPVAVPVATQPAYMDADPMPAFLVSEGEPDLRAILFTLNEF